MAKEKARAEAEKILKDAQAQADKIKAEKEQEKAWVYGLTIIDAIKTYCSVSGTDLVEFDKEDIILEIPKEQWKDYTVYDDESDELDKKTFEQ